MCFSARASFGAAIALTAIGAFSLKSARAPRHTALAAIPLLFAAQQACEGAVWLVLERAPYHVESTPLARAFLFFALFVWPPYIPFALLLVEHIQKRRAILGAFVVAGLVIGTYLMACASLRASNACIAFDNLYYWVQIDAPLKPLMPFVYAFVICAPLVVSSARRTTVLALVVLASFATTGLLYRAGFASVWCFCAALLSGCLVLITRGLDGRFDRRQSAR